MSDATLRAALASECGVTVGYSGADLTDGAAATGLIAEAEAAIGRVDILVNNAGIQHVAPIDEFPPERWEKSSPLIWCRPSTRRQQRSRA